MIIPIEQLSDVAQDNLIKEYCLRDWGLNEQETALDTQMDAVRSAIQQGLLVVLYSELHQSAQLIASSELNLPA